MRGAAIGGSVEAQELSDRKFDPFWAKAEELGVMVFMHPQPAQGTTQNPRLQGKGGLGLEDVGSATGVRGNVDDDAAFEFKLKIFDGSVKAEDYAAGDFLL